MKKIIPLFAITVIALSSCTKQLIISSTQPAEIETLSIVAPESEIYLIKKGNGNKSEYSKELSNKASQMVLYSLESYLSKYHKIQTLKVDSATSALINFQLMQMTKIIANRKRDEIIEIPPSIDSVMAAHNIRYAAFATHNGFSREHGNYGLQVAKGILLGVVTLGTVYYVPYKAMSNLGVCIINGESNSIVYNNTLWQSDIEPIDRKAIEKQVRKIYIKYYLE